VFLQTATTYAYAQNDGTLIPVRVLFDSGSERSYSANHLKKRLGLQPDKKETLNLNTFVQDKFTKQECDVVSLNLKGSEGEDIKVSALCFEKICSPLPTKIDLSRYSKGLHLADSSLKDSSHNQIDILIGSDYYYNVVMGGIQRGENGPVAVKSKFGWILAGPSSREGNHNNTTLSYLVIEPSQPVKYTYPLQRNNMQDDIAESLQRF
jgi:hypothetical protein